LRAIFVFARLETFTGIGAFSVTAAGSDAATAGVLVFEEQPASMSPLIMIAENVLKYFIINCFYFSFYLFLYISIYFYLFLFLLQIIQ
jgi:hypothetical protein